SMMNEFLDKNNVLSDKNWSKNVNSELENAGVLPQFAVEGLTTPEAKQALIGNNGQLDRTKLEQAAAGDGNLSPSSRRMAQAVVDRWDKIDTDGVPGVSEKELSDWAARTGDSGKSGSAKTDGDGSVSLQSFSDSGNGDKLKTADGLNQLLEAS